MNHLIFLSALAFSLACGATASTPPPNARPALVAHDFSALESRLSTAIRAFRDGRLAEWDLIEAYQVYYFFQPDPAVAAALDDWVKQQPESPIAYAARGIYYRKLAEAQRGTDTVQATSRARLDNMAKLDERAKLDLRQSLKLDAACYPAISSLLNIAMREGDDAEADRLIAAGNRAFPANVVLRARYLAHLAPRWGGSYPQMQAFIDATRRSPGVPALTVDLLHAIELDDQGDMAARAGDLTSAYADFSRALALSRRADPRFVAGFLQASVACNCR